mmetsp:Transcript_92700/g.297942  ORF Transcript_92700/g.297942 Transcript_92700/m.297942 type:complete len:96 (+) Transcript_92700:1813-2100(+)
MWAGFEGYTQFQPTLNHNNFNHGYAPVEGGLHVAKKSPLRKCSSVLSPGGAMQRRASAPGFSTVAAVGGARVPRRSRAHADLPGWQAEAAAVGGE